MTLSYYLKPIYRQKATLPPPVRPKVKKRKTYLVEEERIGAIAVEYTDTLATELLSEIQAKARAEAKSQAAAIQSQIWNKTLELRAAKEAAELVRQKAERIAKRQAEAFAIWQDRQERLSVARNELALKRKNRILKRGERNLQIMADLHNIIEIADRYL